MSKPLSRALSGRLATAQPTVVASAHEFLDAQRTPKTVSFLDGGTIASLDALAADLGASGNAPTAERRKLLSAVSLGPVIAISEESLGTALNWLPSRPWLSHIVSAKMLDHPLAKDYLASIMTTLSAGGDLRLLEWLSPKDAGRRVRLTHANRRTERLERMSEFFTSRGVSPATVALLRDATDGLLSYAFYEASVAASPVKAPPIDRSRDVSLPDELACDMVYGFRDDLAIVRVKDPFGSLARQPFIESLAKCAHIQPGSNPDSSIDRAALDLWRVLSAASVVAISTVKHQHTEILVGIPKQESDAHPFAVHLFFKEGAKRGLWKLTDEDSNNRTASFDSSVSVTIVPE